MNHLPGLINGSVNHFLGRILSSIPHLIGAPNGKRQSKSNFQVGCWYRERLCCWLYEKMVGSYENIVDLNLIIPTIKFSKIVLMY